MTRIDYRPGTWIALAGNGLWLLLHVEPDAPLVAECWDLVQANADIHRVSGLLSVRTEAAYALVGRADGVAHAVVRGDASVEFDGTDGTTSVVGTSGPGWIGRTVSEPIDRLRLIGDGAVPGGAGLALVSGVVLASALVVTFGAAVAAAMSEHAVASVVIPIDRAVADAAAVPLATPIDVSASVAARLASPVVASSAEHAQSGGAFAQSVDPSRVVAADPLPAPASPPAPASLSEQAGAAPAAKPQDPERPFAGLFHETTWSSPATPPSATPSAVMTDLIDEPPAAPPARPDPPAARVDIIAPVRPVEAAPPPARSTPRRLGKGLIDDVGWADDPTDAARAVRAAPSGRDEPMYLQYSNAPANVPAPVVGDLDSTIRKPISVGLPSGGPKVSAVQCVSGHFNPLIANSCRVCAGPVPPQDSVVVDRPSLGIIRLSTGEPIRLDRGVILGRAPGTPDGNRRDQPSFVMVADKDISRRHVEVRLDGWDVFVDDLHSSNGTVVTMPGRAPEPLVSGGSRQLLHGTVVHLSDTFSFVFEVTE